MLGRRFGQGSSRPVHSRTRPVAAMCSRVEDGDHLVRHDEGGEVERGVEHLEVAELVAGARGGGGRGRRQGLCLRRDHRVRRASVVEQQQDGWGAGQR